MRLLLSGLFYVHVGRALAHFVLKFVTGLLNSPKLCPIPRASSGSFFAPKSKMRTTRMKRVSGQPGIPKAIGRFIWQTLQRICLLAKKSQRSRELPIGIRSSLTPARAKIPLASL